MAGLILLAALALLITLLVFLSGLATRSLAISVEAKTALRWLIVVGAFLLMVADEMVGMYQFNALCKANGIESADVSKARGKRVAMAYTRTHLVSAGLVLPMEQDSISLSDTDTSEVLVRFKSYFSHGGWLMRYTPISMGSATPMLFDGNGCGVLREQEVLFSNQITVIN